MADTYVNQYIRVYDQASSALQGITRQAQRLETSLNRITRITGLAGGFLGFGFIKKTVDGLDDTYKAVSRIGNLTNMTTKQTYGYVETLKKSNVELTTTERLMSVITRKEEQLWDGLGGGVKRTAELTGAFKKLGIDMKHGPEATLLTMANSIQSGRMNFDEFAKLFQGIPRTQILQVFTALGQGSGTLKSNMEAISKSAGAIDALAMRNWKDMNQAKQGMKVAWDNLSNAFYKEMVPVLTKLFNYIAKHMDEWVPKAQKFGQNLVQNMHKVLEVAKTIIGMFAASKIFNLLGGGISGLMKGGGAAGASEALGSKATRLQRYATAAWRVSDLEVLSGKRGLLDRSPAQDLAIKASRDVEAVKAAMNVEKSMAAAQGSAGGILKIFSGFSKFLGIGALIGGIVEAVKMVSNNVNGWGDIFKESFGTFIKGFGKLIKSFEPVFQKVAELLLPVVTGLFEVLGKIAEILGEGITALTDTFGGENFNRQEMSEMSKYMQKAKYGHELAPLWWENMMMRKPYERWEGYVSKIVDTSGIAKAEKKKQDALKAGADAEEIRKANEKAALDAINQRAGSVINQDFRNSKFDIKQEFAEGFDPDRVALAFSSDLVSLGERQRQANLSVPWAVK